MAEGAEVTGSAQAPVTDSSQATPVAGIFDGMKLNDPAASQPTAQPALDSDPLAARPAEIQATAEVAKPAPGEFEKPFMGRWKTQAEAEQGYLASQQEGMRLAKEGRELRARLQDIETKGQERLRELESQLEEAKNKPAFRDLTPEELKAMFVEDPAKAAEYIADKKLRDHVNAQSKSQREALAKQNAEERTRVQNLIMAESEQMEADSEQWPNYKEYREIQDDINKRCDGKLTGHTWTPKLMYLASLGVVHYQSLIAAKKAGKDSSDVAKRKAEADAAASRGAGGSRPIEKVTTGGDLSDEEFGKQLLAAAPNKNLFGRK